MSENKRERASEATAFALTDGVSPQFTTKLHVGRPNVGNFQEFVALAKSCWDSRYLTNNGPMVRRFEERLQEIMRVKHVICVTNCTVGIEIVLRSFKFKPGSEIIVPSFTFVASAHACANVGLRVRFADCNPRTHCIDVSSVRDLLTENTVAILAVNVWGNPCDDAALRSIAAQRNLKIVYDSAHAFNCSGFGGNGIRGSFGDAEVFSFHATKFFNSCEGGAVTTNNDAVARAVRQYRNFAFVDYDHVVGFGTNAKMSEMHAAAGLVNLKCLDRVIELNRRNYEEYKRGLGALKGIDLLEYDDDDDGSKWNYQYIVVRVDKKQFGISRDDLVVLLHAEGCLARKYFYPGVHRFEPYRRMDPDAEKRVPNTIAISSEVMTLPTGTAVDLHMIRNICALLANVQRSRERLATFFSRAADVRVPPNPQGGSLPKSIEKITESPISEKSGG